MRSFKFQETQSHNCIDIDSETSVFITFLYGLMADFSLVCAPDHAELEKMNFTRINWFDRCTEISFGNPTKRHKRVKDLVENSL